VVSRFRVTDLVYLYSVLTPYRGKNGNFSFALIRHWFLRLPFVFCRRHKIQYANGTDFLREHNLHQNVRVLTMVYNTQNHSVY
jgi:hypothetical protein